MRSIVMAALFFATALFATSAQQAPVTAQVEIIKRGEPRPAPGSNSDASDVAVWLSSLNGSVPPASPDPSHAPQIVQRNKAFEPHVLVVQAGTVVQFPNKDPFFHNVFSLFNGKRFDLGLYEAGSTKSVHIDRVGVSFLFCNIHEEMSAVIVAVDTPYFGLSNSTGHVSIPSVPDGAYQMHVWYERGLPDDLRALERPAVISGTKRSLGIIQVINNPNFTPDHKNKFGEDYVPPPTTGYAK